MAITQTKWDAVSRFNLFASGFCVGCGVTYFALNGGGLLLLGIAMFAAITTWYTAHMKPPEGG